MSVPLLADYQQAEEYYCTLFHELVHSTGHSKRLKRRLDEIAAFGDEVYSREELIAEMGAAMLCGIAKIDNHTIQNSANYIGWWLMLELRPIFKSCCLLWKPGAFGLLMVWGGAADYYRARYDV